MIQDTNIEWWDGNKRTTYRVIVEVRAFKNYKEEEREVFNVNTLYNLFEKHCREFLKEWNEKFSGSLPTQKKGKNNGYKNRRNSSNEIC